jgi:hypothetical protein
VIGGAGGEGDSKNMPEVVWLVGALVGEMMETASPAPDITKSPSARVMRGAGGEGDSKNMPEVVQLVGALGEAMGIAA